MLEKIDAIRKIATEVRQAMEQLKSESKIEWYLLPFHDFPYGCCGDMSIILSTHFKNKGFSQAEYICGLHYRTCFSHAWIRIDGICIDITADQFEGMNFPKVIVEYEENYPLKDIYIPDTEPAYYQIDQDNLRHMYHLLLEQINFNKVLN